MSCKAGWLGGDVASNAARLNWTNWKNEEADQRIEREAVDKPAN